MYCAQEKQNISNYFCPILFNMNPDPFWIDCLFLTIIVLFQTTKILNAYVNKEGIHWPPFHSLRQSTDLWHKR